MSFCSWNTNEQLHEACDVQSCFLALKLVVQRKDWSCSLALCSAQVCGTSRLWHGNWSSRWSQYLCCVYTSTFLNRTTSCSPRPVCRAISSVYREWFEKDQISSERQFCGRKCLVDVRGQKRMGRLVRDDRKATLTKINTHYNQGMQNTISERTTRRTLKQMGYCSRKPHREPLLSANNRKQRQHYRRLEKTLPGLMSLNFCCDIQMSGGWPCWPCPSLYDYSVPIFWWLFPAG